MEAKELVAMLDKYPELKQRLKEMLDIVESPSRGEFSTGDAIEERTLGVVRGIGQNLIQSWAEQQTLHSSEKIKQHVGSAKKNIKKKSIGTVCSEK